MKVLAAVKRVIDYNVKYWPGWNRLRARMGGKFHVVFDAVAQTPRSSALVENLNS